MDPLYDRVLAYIDDAAADRFEDLALAVFRHQFTHCAAYQRFCLGRGATPDGVADWRAIPPVPIVAFKHAELRCGAAARTFLSSGTTQGAETRSRHALPDLRLYQHSALAGLRRFFFPDLQRLPDLPRLPDRPRLRLVSLVPPPSVQPDSSLAQMIAWAMEAFDEGSGAWAADAERLDLERLVERLRASERDGEPLALLTTTGALMRALDALAADGRAFRLPHGSRIMDTGGDKGAPRRLSRNGLLHAVWNAFAVPGYFVVNEYGMAELSSQSYDSVIADRVAGRHAPRRKLAPHWARVTVLDPVTLLPAAPGAHGLLSHVDLANAGTAMAVLSEDIGATLHDGFVLHGRAPGAEARGCSLSAALWDAA